MLVDRPIRVLRLCSVFELPESDSATEAAAFDPVGGMPIHTAALTRALDARGLIQTVVTTRPPTAPRMQKIGRARVLRIGFGIPRPRQLYSVPAAALVPALARRADLIHVHLGEDLAALPIAAAAARLGRRRPLVVTLHCSLRHTLEVVDVRSAALAGLGGWIEERGVRLADAVIVLSHRVAGLLATAGVERSRIHVIPLGWTGGCSWDRSMTRSRTSPGPGSCSWAVCTKLRAWTSPWPRSAGSMRPART